jgi:hypothetical protein
MDIAAGAEVAPGSGDDNALDAVGVNEIAEGISQLSIRFQCQRVLALGPIERNCRDFVAALPEKMSRLEIREIHTWRPEA